MKFRRFLNHIFFWLFYVIYTLISTKINSPSRNIFFWDFLVYYLGDIFVFYYFVILVFPRIKSKQNLIYSIIIIVIGLLTFFLIQQSRLYIKEITFPPSEIIPSHYYSFPKLVLSLLPNGIQFIGFAAAYWYYLNSDKQNTEKLELEKRNHEIEVSFLKSQINQHFIYNMLNMFYVNTMQYSDRLANGLLSLSELMRFSVSHEQDSLIPVLEELKYIESYIHLNQLRFDGKLLVNLNTSGNLESFKIPHLCILTLVENAFKHGDLKKEPLEIKIDTNEDFLTIFIKNKKRSAVIDKSTGIGLNNLERRLSLLLKDKFVLETKEENDFFISLLTIKN